MLSKEVVLRLCFDRTQETPIFLPSRPKNSEWMVTICAHTHRKSRKIRKWDQKLFNHHVFISRRLFTCDVQKDLWGCKEILISNVNDDLNKYGVYSQLYWHFLLIYQFEQAPMMIWSKTTNDLKKYIYVDNRVN